MSQTSKKDSFVTARIIISLSLYIYTASLHHAIQHAGPTPPPTLHQSLPGPSPRPPNPQPRHLFPPFPIPSTRPTPQKRTIHTSTRPNKLTSSPHTARSAAPGISRPPLSWSSDLAASAQAWANNLASANNGLHHSTGDQRPNQGENLYWVSAGGTLADAAQAWVNESSNYSGQKIGEGNFGAYGHYTQCIWPSTTAVGMASAVSGSGAKFIVGRYSPPGNYTGTSAYTGQ